MAAEVYDSDVGDCSAKWEPGVTKSQGDPAKGDLGAGQNASGYNEPLADMNLKCLSVIQWETAHDAHNETGTVHAPNGAAPRVLHSSGGWVGMA
jgi:hypothetical protein